MSVETPVNRLRAWMKHNDFEAFVVKGCSNVRWLTSFHGIADEENPHVVVVTPETATFYTDSRYITVAQEGAKTHPEWTVVQELVDLVKTSAAPITLAKRVATEGSMDILTWQKFYDVLDGELVATKNVIEDLRAVKTDQEIFAITQAQEITDAAFAHMLTYLKVGLTEREVELELEMTMRRLGSTGLAFASIIAAGPNSALPHAVPSDRKIQEGDFLTMDYGAMYGGYRSDMTRTVVFGKATDKHREIYDTVLAANLASIDECRAGMDGRALYNVAFDIIDAAGYGKNFEHGLGHGVGLDIHESPNAGPRRESTLDANAVLTIEPGIYLPGFGGVRIEDMVVIEEGGCRVLTQSPKELIEL